MPLQGGLDSLVTKTGLPDITHHRRADPNLTSNRFGTLEFNLAP